MAEKRMDKVQKNRNISDEDLLNLFDSYDNSQACGFVTEKALMQFSEQKKWDVRLAEKIRLIKSFVSNIQSKLNLKSKSAFGLKYSIERNLFFYADPNMPQVYTKLRILRAGDNNVIPLSLNIPLDKFIKMPALEVYSLLSATTLLAVNQSLNKTSKRLTDINIEKFSDSEIENLVEKAEERVEYHENKRKAVRVLSAYLEKFLPSQFGDKFKEFDDISDLVAMQIVDELPYEKYDEFFEMYFRASQFKDLAIEKVEEFLASNDLEEKRIDALYEKSKEFSQDPDRELQALNVSQQYQALMSNRLKNQFSNLVEQDYLSASNIKIVEFCQNYADSFMASNGLEPIKITYQSNSSDFGTFFDSGSSQRININIKRIAESGGSVTKLVTTLSHELTHAVEASINKLSGKQTADGYGLSDNISNDISSSSLNNNPKSPEFELLRDLNRYCYRINPNERSARYGELSGIKLMQEIATSDKERKQLESTIQTYKNWQSTTLESLKNLSNPEYVAKLESKVNVILNSNIPDEDKDMFVERLEYIKKIMKGQSDFENSMESKSIKEILKGKEEQKIAQELEMVEMQK